MTKKTEPEPKPELPDNEPLPEDAPAKLQFRLVTYRPDQREYRQQSLELTPENPIIISLSIPNDLVYVGEQSSTLELEGLKYLVDRFDTVFVNSTKKSAPASEDEDWEETEKEKSSASEEDDWDKDEKEESNSDKKDWDEENEDWS